MEKLVHSKLKEQIIETSKSIFDQHPSDKFSRDPIEQSIKFPIKGFLDIKFFVSKTNKEYKIANYLFLPESKDKKNISIPKFKGIIYMLHGLGNYSESMAMVAKRFSEEGFIAVSFDYLGHGDSQGEKGDIIDFKYLIELGNKFISLTEEYFIAKYSSKENKAKNALDFIKNKFLYGIFNGWVIRVLLVFSK